MLRLKSFRHLLMSLVLSFLLFVIVFADTPYNRTVSLTGSSATSVASLMLANGYTGNLSLTLLTIKNTGTGIVYFGQADVSSGNGVSLQPNESYTWPLSGDRTLPATKVYLWVSSTQNVTIIALGRNN